MLTLPLDFDCFTIHTHLTLSKVLWYGENSRFVFSARPEVVQLGKKRIANIHVFVGTGKYTVFIPGFAMFCRFEHSACFRLESGLDLNCAGHRHAAVYPGSYICFLH